MEQSTVKKECRIVDGLCMTHGFSVSKDVQCPRSPVSREEWEKNYKEENQYLAELEQRCRACFIRQGTTREIIDCEACCLRDQIRDAQNLAETVQDRKRMLQNLHEMFLNGVISCDLYDKARVNVEA
jgi:hypothetical protein